jgi:hypothetical protein
MQHAGMTEGGGGPDLPTTLPRENDVLSALLIPFLPPGQNAATATAAATAISIADEQRLALEAFEVAVKTWRALTPDLELGRTLWICKAAPSGVSPALRVHLVGVLYSVLFPRGREFRADTPHAILALLAALYALLARLSSSPSNEASIELLQDLMPLIERGQLGMLATRAVEQAYDARAVSGEDPMKIFAEVINGALAGALGSTEGDAQVWLLEHTIQVGAHP